MTRILTGSNLPAHLETCWRAIARHVSETGRFPSESALSEACGCVASHAGTLRRQLVRLGFLTREPGTTLAAGWRLLVWPDGIAPREPQGPTEPRYRTPGTPSKDDIERMRRLKVEDGYSVAEIARKTGFSSYRIEMLLGLRVKDTKPVSEAPTKRRDCLMCGAEFLSEGPGHRVCQTCKGTSRWRGGNDLSFDGPRAGRAS